MSQNCKITAKPLRSQREDKGRGCAANPRSGLNRWTRIAFALLTAASLSVLLAFRSPSLDDFDSFGFALALHDFDLAKQQPQPPGFPVYIALSRLLLLITNDSCAALTTLSAISGVIALASIVALMHRLGLPDVIGVIAAIITALAPIFWLNAEKALSDMPGLAMTLLTMALLWPPLDDPRRRLIGGIVMGLSLGVRAQNIVPILVIVLAILIDRPNWRSGLLPFMSAVAAVLIWLIPLIRDSGGFTAYLYHLSAHSRHVMEADSLIALDPISIGTFRLRVTSFLETILINAVGFTTFDTPCLFEFIRAILLASLLAVGWISVDWHKCDAWLFAIWIIMSATKIFVLESMLRPRLMLPLWPPMVMLAALGWSRLRWPTSIKAVAGFLSAIALMSISAPLVSTLATQIAPPLQATTFIRTSYDPQTTVIAAAGSWRAAQVELPEYRLLYAYKWDEQRARMWSADSTIQYVIVLDRDAFWPKAMDALSGVLVPVDERTFRRDRRVHWQHSEVRLQVLARPESIPPDRRMPRQGEIDIGGDDGRFIDRGWYRPEDITGATARWTGKSLTATLRVTLPAQDTVMRVGVLAYPAGQSVALFVNGREVGRAALRRDWQEVAFEVPASALHDNAVSVIAFVHTRAESPSAYTSGRSLDTRTLAAAYDWVRFDAKR